MIPSPQTKPPPRMNYAARRKAGLVKATPRQRIKPVSAKRNSEGAEYTRLRKEFLAAHPVCQFPGCTCREKLEIHHKARRGRFFLRTDTWMAVCRWCHTQIEQNPTWAKEHGYLVTPEQRRAIT